MAVSIGFHFGIRAGLILLIMVLITAVHTSGDGGGSQHGGLDNGGHSGSFDSGGSGGGFDGGGSSGGCDSGGGSQ
jgi:hypothetical protein